MPLGIPASFLGSYFFLLRDLTLAALAFAGAAATGSALGVWP